MPGSNDSPIRVSEKGEVLYAFIKMVSSRKIHSMGTTGWRTARTRMNEELQLLYDLLEVCNKYQAQRTKSLLRNSFLILADYFPLKVFRNAFELGWKDVAKRAIQNFGCLELGVFPDEPGYVLLG